MILDVAVQSLFKLNRREVNNYESSVIGKKNLPQVHDYSTQRHCARDL